VVKKISQISNVKKEYKFNDDEIIIVGNNILKNLNTEPTNIDWLISKLQIPINLLNTAIIQLEIDNKIAVNYGKIVKLCN
jgi:predicted Rossmann fold nucleotide-binding protein DprA/Smf involved in DNA uptake